MADTGPRRFSLCRLIPLGLLLVASVIFVLSGGRRYLTFATLAEHRDVLATLANRGGALLAAEFILIYFALTALSIPGALVATLVGGFLFGPWLGAVYSLTGATLGATAVFLAARTGLGGLGERTTPRICALMAGSRDDAFNYLLVLRLIPVVPFWVVNLAAGVVGMRLASFAIATFVGMIPAAFIYAGVGNGLGTLLATGQKPEMHLIFQPNILLPLIGVAVLALLPVVYRHWRGRRRRQPVR